MIQNILITGSAGFIGSAVSVLLTKKYPHIKVVNLDKLSYCSNLKNLEEIKDLPNFKFIKGDFCSSDLVNYILIEENIDTIMHFGASTHVDMSFGNSFDFTQNNIMGTHVLLEAAKNYGKINKFIHVSTDEVYGEQQMDQNPMFENSILTPSNPYSSTKAAAEMLVTAYYHSFKLPIIITRGNNVYGEKQHPEKMIPKFINQIRSGKKITLHGKGNSLRNFLYVQDVAKAFEIILFQGVIGEIYNIGGSNEKSVIEVAKEILNLFNESDDKLEYVDDRNFNDFRYHINSDKLKNLGWTEETSWVDGLNETFKWYLENFNQFNDIDRYLEAHPKK